MTTRADVLIGVEDLPGALAAGAQLLDVRWDLDDQTGAGFGRYLQGHLPGARFLDLEAVLTGPTVDPNLGRHPLPDAVQLGAGLGALGVDPARPVVVYDDPGSFAAGRAWWVLRWAGLDVRVLDGGLRAWIASGRPLETDEPDATPGGLLALAVGQLPTLDVDEVAAFDGMLIDVRSAERFAGAVGTHDTRGGHIPGAVNRPVSGYWDADGLLPPADELVAKLDLPPADVPVTVYCGSGVSAAQVILALASLGVDAALYPPSWSGWSADPDRPAATGAAMPGALGASSAVTTRLDHIRANLEAVRAHVGDRLVLVAVKADAYGHGAVEVARMAERTGAADQLGVATTSEGLELRAAGVGLPILKFSPARGEEVAAAVGAGLTLCVVDEASIIAAAAAASAQGTTARVHLKVDTGMRRIGCEPEQAPGLAALVDATPGVELEGVFSHLPISDSPRGTEFTRDQIALFRRAAGQVEAVHGPVLKHLANSGAVLGHPDAWFDMVRPGIIAYGAYPDPEAARTVPLLPGLEWRTRVSFTKQVRAGETVGYGRTWTAPADTWIATVPVGYGDGYSRLLSNRGRMLVGGRSYPIVGRVCMDQTMLDLGPSTDVEVGDEVVLVGRDGADEITTSEIAEAMGTIPYEVTCLITARVARTWVG